MEPSAIVVGEHFGPSRLPFNAPPPPTRLNRCRIKKTLPEPLWPLLPLDPTPVCPYLDGATGIPASLQRIAGEIRPALEQPLVQKKASTLACSTVNGALRDGRSASSPWCLRISKLFSIFRSPSQATCLVASAPGRKPGICRPGWMETMRWMIRLKACPRPPLTLAGGRTC